MKKGKPEEDEDEKITGHEGIGRPQEHGRGKKSVCQAVSYSYPSLCRYAMYMRTVGLSAAKEGHWICRYWRTF